uniref:RPA43 OB domain-containing protein n=1 Tax=Anopheles christyi TaxID=43041 RepID=A0A182JUN9_9DIPT
MHRTTIAKFTKFSAEELKKSLADPLSCVVAVQLNEILSLRPRDCEHIVKGVRRCVTDKIGRYHAKVNGIVLGYAKIRVDNALSALRLDSPYLHVRATIDYYVFRPQIGSTLRGTVNYVSKEFVSAVIYRVFNVTVKLGTNANQKHKIKKDTEISFTVKSCDMKSELPVIEGELVLNGILPVCVKREPGIEDEDSSIEEQQEDDLEENAIEPETVDDPTTSLPEVTIKKEPITPKHRQLTKQTLPKKVPTASNGGAAALANFPSSDDSSSSESEDNEKSLLINSLLGSMFGDEFTNSKKSSKKDKKKKKEKKSPQKTIVPETVKIKQEPISTDEDEPSDNKQNSTNGFRSNGNVAASPDVDDVQTTGKKRKIRFNLNHTIVSYETEPTESSKKKKTLNKK